MKGPGWTTTERGISPTTIYFGCLVKCMDLCLFNTQYTVKRCKEETYRTMCVQPHHPNNLICFIIRVKCRLALTSNAIEGNRDGINRDPARRVHDGQFRAGFIPAQMNQQMTTMGLSDWQQRRIIAESPLAIRGSTVKMTDIDSQAVSRDVCNTSKS